MEDFMSEMINILTLNNEIEANLLEEVLNENDIPFIIKNFHDNAYDGLFQMQFGWGVVESYEENREKIIEFYDLIKKENKEFAADDNSINITADEMPKKNRSIIILFVVILSILILIFSIWFYLKYCVSFTYFWNNLLIRSIKEYQIIT
jgi:hypothetical protein